MKPGNAMPLKSIPVGTIVHNIELKPLKGAPDGALGRLLRASRRPRRRLRAAALASGEVRMVPDVCMATIGAVSNPDNMNEVWGKAGRSVWLGRQARACAASP